MSTHERPRIRPAHETTAIAFCRSEGLTGETGIHRTHCCATVDSGPQIDDLGLKGS
jgi:hypothetical protein